MRSISISNYMPPARASWDPTGQSYAVMLGNDTVHLFPNKRACMVFLTETSRFLTLKMHDCNMVLGHVYAEYRRIWPYLFDIKADNELLDGINKKLLRSVKDAPYYLEKIVEMGYSPNYNHMVFDFLTACYRELETGVLALIDFHKHRSQGADAHLFSVVADNIRRARTEVADYGRGRANVYLLNAQPPVVELYG